MANPITWRSVAAPNFSGVTDAMNSGRQALTQGLTGLAGQADQQMTEVTDQNTQAMLQRIQERGQGGLQGLDALDQMQTEVAPDALQQQFGRGIDRRQVFDAMNTQRGVAEQQAVGQFNERLAQAQQTGDFTGIDELQQQLVNRLNDASGVVNQATQAREQQTIKDVGLALAQNDFGTAEKLAGNNPELLKQVTDQHAQKRLGDLNIDLFDKLKEIEVGADPVKLEKDFVEKIKSDPELLSKNPTLLYEVTAQINQASVRANTLSEGSAQEVSAYEERGRERVVTDIVQPMQNAIESYKRKYGITEGVSLQQELGSGVGGTAVLEKYNKANPDNPLTSDRLTEMARYAKVDLAGVPAWAIYGALTLTENITGEYWFDTKAGVGKNFGENLKKVLAVGDLDKVVQDNIRNMENSVKQVQMDQELELHNRTSEYRSQLIKYEQDKKAGREPRIPTLTARNYESILPSGLSLEAQEEFQAMFPQLRGINTTRRNNTTDNGSVNRNQAPTVTTPPTVEEARERMQPVSQRGRSSFNQPANQTMTSERRNDIQQKIAQGEKRRLTATIKKKEESIDAGSVINRPRRVRELAELRERLKELEQQSEG